MNEWERYIEVERTSGQLIVWTFSTSVVRFNYCVKWCMNVIFRLHQSTAETVIRFCVLQMAMKDKLPKHELDELTSLYFQTYGVQGELSVHLFCRNVSF